MTVSREKVAGWQSTEKLEAVFIVDVVRDYFDCDVAFGHGRTARLVFKVSPPEFEVEDMRFFLATNPAHNFRRPIKGPVGAKAINPSRDWLGFLSGIAPNPSRFLRIWNVDNLDSIYQHRSSVPVYHAEARAAAVASFSLRLNRWLTVAKDERRLFSLFSKLTSSKSNSHTSCYQSNPSAQCAEPALQATSIPFARVQNRKVWKKSNGERYKTKHRYGAAANVKRSLVHRQYLERREGQKAQRTRPWQGEAA